FVFLRSLGYVRLDRMPASALERKRNRAMRAALQPLGRRLRQFRSADEMWPVVIEAAKVVGAVAVHLQAPVPGATEAADPVLFNHDPFGNEGAPIALYRSQFVVPGSRAM